MMLLSILILNGFSSLSASAAAVVGIAMAGACIVAIGMLGRPWGYGFGHLVQVAMVGLGALAVPILVIGVLFAGLWITAYVIGMRIDRARAIR